MHYRLEFFEMNQIPLSTSFLRGSDLGRGGSGGRAGHGGGDTWEGGGNQLAQV